MMEIKLMCGGVPIWTIGNALPTAYIAPHQMGDAPGSGCISEMYNSFTSNNPPAQQHAELELFLLRG